MYGYGSPFYTNSLIIYAYPVLSADTPSAIDPILYNKNNYLYIYTSSYPSLYPSPRLRYQGTVVDDWYVRLLSWSHIVG